MRMLISRENKLRQKGRTRLLASRPGPPPGEQTSNSISSSSDLSRSPQLPSTSHWSCHPVSDRDVVRSGLWRHSFGSWRQSPTPGLSQDVCTGVHCPIVGPLVQTLFAQKPRLFTAFVNQECTPLSTAHDLIRPAWICEQTHRIELSRSVKMCVPGFRSTS